MLLLLGGRRRRFGLGCAGFRKKSEGLFGDRDGAEPVGHLDRAVHIGEFFCPGVAVLVLEGGDVAEVLQLEPQLGAMAQRALPLII
jgi:hypothetical protein